MKKISALLILASSLSLLSGCSKREDIVVPKEEEQEYVHPLYINRKAFLSVYDFLHFNLTISVFSSGATLKKQNYIKQIESFPYTTLEKEKAEEEGYVTYENANTFLTTGRYFRENSNELTLKISELENGVVRTTYSYIDEAMDRKYTVDQTVPYGTQLPETYNLYTENIVNLIAQAIFKSREIVLYSWGSTSEEYGDLPTSVATQSSSYTILGKKLWFTIDGLTYYAGNKKMTKGEWQEWLSN